MKPAGYGGKKRSNPFEKHKQDLKEKRLRQEAEAAKVYDDFVESFQTEDRKELLFVSKTQPKLDVTQEDEEILDVTYDRGAYDSQAPVSASKDKFPETKEKTFKVPFPKDKYVKGLIDITVEWVSKKGIAFEKIIADTEAENPDYGFLHNEACDEHIYYRWKLFDSAFKHNKSFMVDSTPFVEGSPLWLPPSKQPNACLGMKHNESRQLDISHSGKLWEDLSLERSKIREATLIIMDNSKLVCNFLDKFCAAFIDKAAAPKQIARLYLLSDILYNCLQMGNKAAHALLEEKLPDVFDNLNASFTKIQSRIEQEGFRRRLMSVLRAWNSWSAFPPNNILSLQASAMRLNNMKSDEKIEELLKLPEKDLESMCGHLYLSKLGTKMEKIHRIVGSKIYCNKQNNMTM